MLLGEDVRGKEETRDPIEDAREVERSPEIEAWLELYSPKIGA